MTSSTKYILYCAQECNFQTRSMLIPYDKIMQCETRVDDLQILRQHSIKNASFDIDGKIYLVDQLLIQNINWENGYGTTVTTPFNKIIKHFTSYADGEHQDVEWYIKGEDYLTYKTYKSGDEVWSRDVICHLTKGFDHVKNYCKLRNITEYEGKNIEIVEGFLILESDDGKLNYYKEIKLDF